MIKNYQKKDIKKTPTKDGEIFRKNNVWMFKWKGSECGYLHKSDAEASLKRLSDTVEKET